MSSLTIRKKSLNTWVHNDSIFGDFIISKFYFNSYENEFRIVEEGNSRLVAYTIGNITLYDDTDGGTAETFSTITELSLRLEELLYPAFDRTGMTIFPTMEQITNVNVTDIEDGQVLVWDATTNKWINTTIGGSTTQVTSKVVYCTLDDVGATSPFQEDIDTLVKDWVVAQEITKADNEDYLFVLVDELPTEINFDIEATDWASGGITDEASFVSFLEEQGATNVVVTGFSLIDGRLQCNLSFDGTTEFYLIGLGITKINNVSSLINLTYLNLRENQISTIENLETLVNLTYLNLSYNQISTIENLETLINLTSLELHGNQISTIENLEALVNLTYLDLSQNQISTIENLSSLINLTYLGLSGNQIYQFDENVLLSTSLETIGFENNNFTTADYTNAEAWATNQLAFTNPCIIYFDGNPDSSIGTTFEAILLTKNATLTY